MAKTKGQKQRDIEHLKTKDRTACLESEQKRKKKKLEQLKKDEAAYNLHLQKDRLRKAAKKVSFHLVDKLKALLDDIKIS